MTGLVILFFVSVWAGIQNALAGGGTFLTLPALMFTGMNPLADKVGGTKPGPVLGPTKLATRRAAAEREVQRVLRRFGPAASARLLWVIVENKEISAWCCMFSEHHGVKKPDAKLEFGRLLAGLDQLAEHYGVNSERDRKQALNAAMERL